MSRPRVLLLGNMNNCHFALARYMRDEGMEAHVRRFDDEHDHFHPSRDTWDDGYSSFVTDLPWGSVERFAETRASEVAEVFDGFDLVVGCGAAPAYAHKARRRLDVFIPYGWDLWKMPTYHLVHPRRMASHWKAVGPHRRGIAESRVIHMAATNEMYEGRWKRFRGASLRWYEGVPNVYVPRKREAPPASSEWYSRFREIRQRVDLMLFSSVRHAWTMSHHEPQAKGTDRLLRAIALFRKAHPKVRIALVTMEYGADVDASKRLVTRLGLSDVVEWFPTMPRREIMLGLALADMACAEFENSWIASGVLYEALALGRPILAYRDDSLYPEQDLYPIMNAKEPHEIAERLVSAAADPEGNGRLGAAGRRWFDEHVVRAAMLKYKALGEAWSIGVERQ